MAADFTINEMRLLLLDTASDDLYDRVLQLLRNMTFLKGSTFYLKYVNETGVRVFMKIVAANIDKEFLIIAENMWNKQKLALIDLCGGLNDDFKKAQLAQYMDPDDLLKALAEDKKRNKRTPRL